MEINGLPGKEQCNGDGASMFRVFDAREMPANLVVRQLGFDGISHHGRAPSPAGAVKAGRSG